ncbi:MAG: hypothetical protein AAB343_03445 [Patescibacteria group bacterium]
MTKGKHFIPERASKATAHRLYAESRALQQQALQKRAQLIDAYSLLCIKAAMHRADVLVRMLPDIPPEKRTYRQSYLFDHECTVISHFYSEIDNMIAGHIIFPLSPEKATQQLTRRKR